MTGSSHLIVNLRRYAVCLLDSSALQIDVVWWIDDNYLDVNFSSTGRMRARNTNNYNYLLYYLFVPPGHVITKPRA